MNLKDKTVILGITGSIAAYKMADVASALSKMHCDVHTIMTKNATEIITPLTFSTLTSHHCIVDTFDKNINYNVAHVALAKKADALLIAPATANIIAKLACGLADDMLTTTTLACTCPKIIAPAMNTAMFENPVVQRNIETLRQDGWVVIEPASGVLACKDTGKGKLPDPSVLMDYVLKEVACKKDLNGEKILVTAGPTYEALDPVRFLSNHSSGRMGYAIARMAMLRGADVTLISGPTSLTPIPFITTLSVTSAADMAEAVLSLAPQQDVIIKAAAVADFTPLQTADEKIKKHDGALNLALKKTQDILRTLGTQKRPGQFICGFSMETQNLEENSRKKLFDKKIDMIVANNLREEGAGFQGNTNRVTLITADQVTPLPLLSKNDVALKILDAIKAAQSL